MLTEAQIEQMVNRYAKRVNQLPSWAYPLPKLAIARYEAGLRATYKIERQNRAGDKTANDRTRTEDAGDHQEN